MKMIPLRNLRPLQTPTQAAARENSMVAPPYVSAFRRKRFELVIKLLRSLPDQSIDILDLGGSQAYWESVGFWETEIANRCKITLLNLGQDRENRPNVTSTIGDARDLRAFGDQSFSFVFSNSVIEHVGKHVEQARMAAEVRRVGRSYYVQTPNLWFPIEAHSLLPGFQFLPSAIKARMIYHFRVGYIEPMSTLAKARGYIESLTLVSERDLKRMFPDGVVVREKFAGLVKSLAVYRLGNEETKETRGLEPRLLKA
jgi:hypothetical protein